jgi:hypothetical protein
MMPGGGLCRGRSPSLAAAGFVPVMGRHKIRGVVPDAVSARGIVHLLATMQSAKTPSRPREFHPEPLTDRDLILSHHPARAIDRRLPPSAGRRASPVAGWPGPAPMTRPLRSSPITGPRYYEAVRPSPDISISAPFVWRCLTGLAVAPFPHPAHRTGQADLPHPAPGQDLTPSPMTARAPARSDARARSARKGARVDRSRSCAA